MTPKKATPHGGRPRKPKTQRKVMKAVRYDPEHLKRLRKLSQRKGTDDAPLLQTALAEYLERQGV